ncbi:MAG: DNA adenine methylase [Crenarchaeota archaeon]|nr:DNA adenine methylase [Thermoproteota archaeon]
MGGDSFLLPYIAKMIPPHEIYVEVFGGGAPLLLNKPPSKLDIYNDLDDKLVNLFMVVRDKYDEFIKRFEFIVASRTLYYDFIKKLDNNEFKDPIDKAVAYYYVMRLSYAGKYAAGLGFGLKGGGHPTRTIWSPLRKVKLIWQRLKHVVVENLDFREILQRYDSDKSFFYVDPPHLYLSTEQGMKGVSYYDTNSFTEADYMDLLNRLERLKGKFLLKQSTYIPWLIEWAKEHKYQVVTLKLKKLIKRNPKQKKTDLYTIYFIANYRIITY